MLFIRVFKLKNNAFLLIRTQTFFQIFFKNNKQKSGHLKVIFSHRQTSVGENPHNNRNSSNILSILLQNKIRNNL